MLIGLEMEGDRIVGEHRLAIDWKGSEEIVRLTVLSIYTAQILSAAEKHRRRFETKVERIMSARGEALSLA